MKIYETGASARRRYLGQRANGKMNNVCVLDKTEGQTVEVVFGEMLSTLIAKENIETVDRVTLTVATTKATYVLAHEMTFDKKGNKVLTPSNLLRYLFTRTFSIDTLYFNEDNEVVDIADAAQDIQNRVLRPLLPYEQLIVNDINILLESIYMRLCKDYVFNNDIETTFRYLPVNLLKPLEGENEWVNKMLAHSPNFISWLSNYSRLHDYMFGICKLQSKVLFTPTAESINNYEAAYKKWLEKPKHIPPAQPEMPIPQRTSAGIRLTTGPTGRPTTRRETMPPPIYLDGNVYFRSATESERDPQ